MNIKGIIIGAVAFIAIVIGYFAFTVNINQGHEGVVFSRSNGVEEQTLPQGLHFVNPMKRITEYPVSTETVKTKLKLATKDGKPLTVEITYDYKNEANKLPYIYNKFKGQEPEVIEEGWLQSRLKKSANSVTSKHTILEVFQQTEAISLDVEKAFHKNVGKDGFIIESVTFGTPEPDANTANAIQAVVNAQQQVEQLRIEKQKAQLQAEKDLIQAQGVANAEVEKAKGIAESNKLLQQSITPELIKLKEAEARLKHGWVEVQTGQAIVENK